MRVGGHVTPNQTVQATFLSPETIGAPKRFRWHYGNVRIFEMAAAHFGQCGVSIVAELILLTVTKVFQSIQHPAYMRQWPNDCARPSI
jgi:hypothetical protein